MSGIAFNKILISIWMSNIWIDSLVKIIREPLPPRWLIKLDKTYFHVFWSLHGHKFESLGQFSILRSPNLSATSINLIRAMIMINGQGSTILAHIWRGRYILLDGGNWDRRPLIRARDSKMLMKLRISICCCRIRTWGGGSDYASWYVILLGP